MWEGPIDSKHLGTTSAGGLTCRDDDDDDVDDDGDDNDDVDDADDDDDEDGRAKEAAKKPNRRAKKKGFEKPDADAGVNMIRCQMCKLTFASGNALHKHLKDAHSGVHKKKR